MMTTDPFAPIDENFKRSAAQPPIEDKWTPILPVPETAPELTRDMLKRFAPPDFSVTTGWRYRDAKGRLLGCVARFDKPANGSPAEKQVKPFTFCQGPNGRMEWRSKAFLVPRPLFGLDRLAERPDAPVLVVEGEKAANAGGRRFKDYVVITSSGGSMAARKTDWSPIADRRVFIWPDADEPGKRYAENVAEIARQVGAASVHVVKLPSGLPAGWDLADELPASIGEDKLVAMLADAAPAFIDGPIPILPPMPPAERFPIEALGPVLANAAAAISSKVQVPEAIAAQSVLAAAALAAQAHADVLLPYGQTRPLSLFFVTVAASGDRKSTADNEALWPIRRRERTLQEKFEESQRQWSIEIAAYNAEKKKIEGNRKLDFEARKAALAALGAEPEKPLYPFLTAPEPTIEGLVKAWSSAPAALGIFTAEGGQFIGGHGMSQDHRLKSAAGYSGIWDGQPIKRIRSMDGVSILNGRRLSMHLMVQDEAAAQFLSDDLLRDQGLLSRVLVAAPDSIAGTRFYRDPSSENDAAIRVYGAQILSILEAPWPLSDGCRSELIPRVLSLTKEATAAWCAFHDHIEIQCGQDGALLLIRDFAAKSAEHAARIAGVLTIVEDVHAPEIGINAMHRALVLADWYVNEALRLRRADRTEPKLLIAQSLLDWMCERGEKDFGFREIVQYGPSHVRTKKAAEDALGTLAAHGWIAEVSSRPRRFRLIKEA
jgi:hypothetical protein